MISLIVPWFGGSTDPLKSTIDSVRGICSEVVIVHQKLFDDDSDIASSLADKVATLDWNAVFCDEGYGLLPNAGAAIANGPWMMLLGTGETVAETFCDLRDRLSTSDQKTLFRCSHHGDPHRWKRLWRPSAGTYFSGPIHEEAIGGPEGDVLFRMQDLPKSPLQDSFRNECLKWLKTCSYHSGYYTLLHRPELRGGCNEGWLKFVAGARESIEEFVETNQDLMEAAWEGDRDSFYEGVSKRMDDGRKPDAVNHNPTGEPMSEGALPAPV